LHFSLFLSFVAKKKERKTKSNKVSLFFPAMSRRSLALRFDTHPSSEPQRPLREILWRIKSLALSGDTTRKKDLM
jgi:hypothetical protein